MTARFKEREDIIPVELYGHDSDQTPYQTVNVKQHIANLIFYLYGKGEKVCAIKFVRAEYAPGVKESKDICDLVGGRPIAEWA